MEEDRLVVMPSPDWNGVTLRWKGRLIDGAPATGRLIITSDSPRFLDDDAVQSESIIADGVSIIVPIVAGYAEIEVPATDDPDITPNGFTYTIVEQLDKGVGRTIVTDAPLEKAVDGIDLNRLVSIDPSPGTDLPPITRAELDALAYTFVRLDQQAIALDEDGTPYWADATDVGEDAMPVRIDSDGRPYVYVPDEGAPTIAYRDAPNGLAPLDSTGRVPQSNLPTHLDPIELSASIDGAALRRPSAGVAIAQAASQPISGGVSLTLGRTSPVTYVGADPNFTTAGVGTKLFYGAPGVEVEVWGDKIAFSVYCQSTLPKVTITVADLTPFGYGTPETLTPADGLAVDSAASDAIRWISLTFPDDRRRRVTFFTSDAYLRSVATTADGAVAPVPQPRPDIRLLALGDSYIAGAVGIRAHSTFAAQIGPMLGIGHVMLAGEGGTGYVNTGPGADTYTTDFGDPVRLAQVIAAAPTDLLVVGSINDDGQTVSAIYTAAKTFFDAVVAALPTVRLHVLGPQSGTAASDVTEARQANMAAVAAAARASTRLFTYIDPVTEGWLTTVNRSRFLATDNVHLTAEGHAYYAARVAAALRPSLATGAAAITPTTLVALDRFGRADGSLGTTDIGGRTWATSQGTWQVVSGKAKPTTGVSASIISVAVFDAGTANVALEVDITNKVWGGGVAFGLTASGSAGYVVVANTSEYTLYARGNGTAKTALAHWTHTVVVGERLRVTKSGSTITAYVNGTQIGTATDSTYSGTYAGMASDDNFHSTTLDNFTCTAL